MNLPNMRHEFFNEDSGVRYVVMAYQQLSKDDLMRAIVLNVMLMKKKPRRGETHTFLLSPCAGDSGQFGQPPFG